MTLLGDLITRLADETVAADTLTAIGDLALTAGVVAAASRDGVAPGAFIVSCVQRFADGASDEEWLTMLGRLAQAEDPGRVFLRRALESGLPSQNPQ
jgi:hypothetical protein